MIEKRHLLTDEQVAEFITRGYLVLRNDLPSGLHELVLEKVAKVMKEEGNPGNNILPRVPEIQEFFETPQVKGALTSILGPDYYMHPHRHCHYNPPGKSAPQEWHKDGFWSSMRSHRPWWAIIFYYAQDITEDMGPTGIMPGTQFYEEYPGDDCEFRMPYGKAGTMVLVHFDLWHRASLNKTLIDRYMLKFQFVRLQAPTHPSWNHRQTDLILPDSTTTIPTHQVVWNDIWSWMMGKSSSNHCYIPGQRSEPIDMLIGELDDEDAAVRLKAADELGLLGDTALPAVPALTIAMNDAVEAVAINAAYALGKIGPEGICSLLQILTNGREEAALRAAYGLSAAGEQAVRGLIHALKCQDDVRRGYAAFALGMIGTPAQLAVDNLIELLRDHSIWVRRNAVEALGMIRQPSRDVVPALIRGLEDKGVDHNAADYVEKQGYIFHKVRYAAALSLLRLGKETEAQQAVSALRQALNDGDRYVRAYACEAMTHIKTDQAVQTLIEYFRMSRWCPSTSKESTF